MKKWLVFAFLNLFLNAQNAAAQTDPVLFTVNKTPVNLSEFKYIYQKTNAAKADFSKASLEEYLDLYTKFKVKVQRARDMKLDTIEGLREELAGYRRQLAETYLTDREVTDKLVAQAHTRMGTDVAVSHILVAIPQNGDTIAAFGRIREAKVRLEKGESFEKLAKELSEDKGSKEKGGYIGFITAMLPDGFYALENAIFNTSKGKHSEIVRSPQGYHIIFVNDTRPARGEIEVAHLLIRSVKDGIDQPNAQNRIDSIYKALKAGANFDELAQNLSEDGYSAARAGYLGSFGVGRFEPSFEDAAFALAQDGAFSAPVSSRLGFHIIKRVSRKPVPTLDQSRTRLKTQIQQDSRFGVAKQAMIDRIKSDNKAVINENALKSLESKLDSTFGTYDWTTPEVPKTELFNFGNGKMSVNLPDFVTYLQRNPNERVGNFLQNKSIGKTLQMMYGKFTDDRALAYEEQQLDVKYPDFRALMREYEEGILLFEAIKQNVWDKASQDTVGLEKFFGTRRDKYVWNERAEVVTYFLIDSAKNQINDLRKFAAKKSPQDVLKKFNRKGKKEIVSFKIETIEKGKNKKIDALGFAKGKMSDNETNKSDNALMFQKVEKIIPTTQKTLKEARGFVVADYQDFLEKDWTESLNKMYPIAVDRAVFESLIKK